MKPRRRRPQSAAALVAIVWPRARPHPSRHELEVWNFSRAARVSGATRVKNTGNPATCAPSTLYRVVWLRPTRGQRPARTSSPRRARSLVRRAGRGQLRERSCFPSTVGFCKPPLRLSSGNLGKPTTQDAPGSGASSSLSIIPPRRRSSLLGRRKRPNPTNGRRHCQGERVLAVVAAIQRRRRSLASYASKLR